MKYGLDSNFFSSYNATVHKLWERAKTKLCSKVKKGLAKVWLWIDWFLEFILTTITTLCWALHVASHMYVLTSTLVKKMKWVMLVLTLRMSSKKEFTQDSVTYGQNLLFSFCTLFFQFSLQHFSLSAFPCVYIIWEWQSISHEFRLNF